MLGDGQGTRPWVYYAKSSGRFRSLHRYSGLVLMAIYLGVPWINIAGQPLFRADLPGRRVFLLGQMFTALDTRFLFLAVLFGAIGLGLITAVLGRVWCGYLCPQTVFLEELVRRIEVWIEGDRGARRKLDRMPWNAEKIRKKGLKYFLILVLSFALSMVGLSYFNSPLEVWTFQSGTGTYVAVGALTAALYIDLAWFREQFCNYLCPYARIQGALTDEHSLVIGYDFNRGEPRLGKGIKKAEVLDRGGCVSCNRCVTVCPQGIDIRNGYQLECIACGHCVDACTEVMGKHDHPSLVTYTTEAALNGRQAPKVRARPIVYAVIMSVLLGLGVWSFSARESFDARVTRTAGTYAVVLDDGSIQNMFDAHIWNNFPEDRHFEMSVDGLPGGRVVSPPITVDAGEDRMIPVFVIADAEAGDERSIPFTFIIESGDERMEVQGTFIPNGTPAQQGGSATETSTPDEESSK